MKIHGFFRSSEEIMHPSPRELQQLLHEARSLKLGSPAQLQMLKSIRMHCPAFVPALLISSRAELWGEEDDRLPETFFNEVEQMLHEAVDASGRAPAALIGLARFMNVVRDSPHAAEALFREASTKALEMLEESWAGLIETLGEQEKMEEAARTAKSAREFFPQSRQISEACQFAQLDQE
jgi:thioredoxin-like negative regulator of GroEL